MIVKLPVLKLFVLILISFLMRVLFFLEFAMSYVVSKQLTL